MKTASPTSASSSLPLFAKARSTQILWIAFLLHRISGLLLAIFLPFHFWVLSLAIRDADKFAQFLSLTDNLLIKIAETGLVALLGIHFFGGLRLMAFEGFNWPSAHKTAAASVFALSCAVALLFLFNAVKS